MPKVAIRENEHERSTYITHDGGASSSGEQGAIRSGVQRALPSQCQSDRSGLQCAIRADRGLARRAASFLGVRTADQDRGASL